MLITDSKALTPDYLTAILRAADVLREDETVNLVRAVNKGKTQNARYHIISLQYKDYLTQRHAPDRLFVKISDAIQTEGFARREVDFYTRIVPVMKRRLPAEHLRFPAMYDAYFDDSSGRYHLILDDISQHFKPSPEKIPPAQRHREQVIDTLGHLHGFWWEHALLADLAPLPDETTLDTMLTSYQAKFNELNTAVGQYLEKQYLDILETVASRWPQRRRERLLAGKGLTVVHRDLHPDNLLYSPRDTYIIDWQSWRIDTGTDDLAYMIGGYWPDHLRKFQEMALLRRYFNILEAQGVTDYEWDDLLYDYKASMARVLGFLLAAWTRSKHVSGYWTLMEHVMDIFIDLDGLKLYT